MPEQIHDYNPHVAPNGLFWTIPVPRDSVRVNFGAGRAAFRLAIDEIPDDHDLRSSLTEDFPPGFPQIASVAFDIQWSGVLDRQNIRNEAMSFEGQFIQTGATIRWSARNPATGFEFVSEPPNPARNVYSFIGRERNGVFFS